MDKFKEKQNKLDNLRKSELVFNSNTIINDLADIIFLLLFVNVPTFWKRNNKLYRQITGSMRSIEDCYLLAKHYFPKIDYKTVYNAVQSNYTNPTKEYPFLGKIYCYNVKRIVHTRFGSINDKTNDLIRKRLNDNNTNYTN